jgi:DNA primase
MKPRLLNLDAICKALKPFLGQYLQEHGINTEKNFRCLNPKHNDETASMTIKQYPEQAFCFGCSYVLDIFKAATLLEGKPDKGKDWIEENVLYLAKKYGIQTQLVDLTPEEVYEYRTYRAYQLASELVSDPRFGNYELVDKEIGFRKWDKEKIANWGIGTVNYDEFRDRLKKAGFEPKFLDGIDLSRSDLFDNNNMIFTVYDDEGRPVGFSAKRLAREEGDGTPKYINTRQTGLECAIFKKGERLYGYDIAKEAPGPIYIFEGQANVITLRHHGLMNCCATMGTALTDHHITLLKKHGTFNVILVFDGDNAGHIAAEKALDEKFAKEKDFQAKICQMPPNTDPDELVRERGFDEFARLKRWTAFEWRMMKFMQSVEGDIDEEQQREIAEKMIPIIVAEQSHLRQEEMAKQVAKVTGYDISTIKSEIRRLRDEKDAVVQTKKKNAIEALLYDVRRNPEDAELALAQATQAINNINKSIQSENESSSTISMITALKEADELKSGEFAGFFMKPDGLGNIAARLNDDWKTDSLTFIGGEAQASKTTFVTQMAYEIADDPRNDAMCIYHSIDDAAKRIVYKLICNASDNIKLELNHVSNPNYWLKQDGYEYIKALREKGYRKILKLIGDNRLVIKDASDGNSLTYIEGIINYYRELYPNRKIVLIGDNFHKYPDYSDIHGHEAAKKRSNHLKNLAISKHLAIINTVEYRKLQPGEMPHNLALAESRSLIYDADTIIHLYNDLHHKGEHEAVLLHYNEEGKALPRIWCKFGKNKISGFEGREFLDLYPSSAKMFGVDTTQAEEDQRIRLDWLAENSKKKIY